MTLRSRFARFSPARRASRAPDASGAECRDAGVPQAASGGLATAADVLACFRLLLGRAPADEEMTGHMMQVGQSLESVVAGYLGSREFADRRLGAGRGELPPVLVRTAEGFQLMVPPADAAVGAAIAASGRHEPHVTRAFAAELRPGQHVLDIGANIGWFTMLAAARVGVAGRVTAIEPNGGNARLIELGRRANGFENVVILQVAAARASGLLALYRTHSNGSTGTIGSDAALLEADTVPAFRLDELLAGAPPVDLIKIDVEGAEAAALEGLDAIIRRDRPPIVSEFAPNMMPGGSGRSGAEYLGWLGARGYGFAVIEADGRVTQAASPDAVLAAHVASGVDHIDILCRPA